MRRFGKSHLTENGRNIKIKREVTENYKNFLSKDLQHSLRKKIYNFSKSERIIALNDGRKKIKMEATSEEDANRIGCCDDSDLVKLRANEKKKV